MPTTICPSCSSSLRIKDADINLPAACQNCGELFNAKPADIVEPRIERPEPREKTQSELDVFCESLPRVDFFSVFFGAAAAIGVLAGAYMALASDTGENAGAWVAFWMLFTVVSMIGVSTRCAR